MPFPKRKRTWPVKEPHKKIFPTYLFYAQESFFYLFHALLFLLFIYPYAEILGEEHQPWILNLAHSIVIIAMVYTVSFNWRQLVTALILGIPAIILTIFDIHSTEGISLTLTTLLYIYIILLIIPFLIHSERAGVNEVYAVASLYILLGLTWSNFYQGVEWVYPGSFFVDRYHNIDQVLNWSDFVFFSFTTLTTLGYGDITPITSQGRSLAIIEAITGVMFLGTFLARTVGLSIYHGLLNHRNSDS